MLNSLSTNALSTNVAFYTTNTHIGNPDEASRTHAARATAQELDRPAPSCELPDLSASSSASGASQLAAQKAPQLATKSTAKSTAKSTTQPAVNPTVNPTENADSDDTADSEIRHAALADGDEQTLCPVDSKLIDFLTYEINDSISTSKKVVNAVATRLAIEVTRICRKSKRIQASGEIQAWQRSLALNRIKKYLDYYNLGSKQGRIELHSRLSAIAYRYIAPARTHMGFQGRCTLLEDFLQSFYIEVLKAFRRENHLSPDYTPRTRLELAEYMAFSEHYAKRRISLPGCYNQQLLVLRAQAFARRLPAETAVDMETAVDSPKSEDDFFRSPAIAQIREKMVANTIDPSDAVLRDRIIQELIEYLEDQNQQACIDYLTLRLQDMAASEIDEVLGLSSRQRDYLQQRFKYHVEKFAQFHRWELVHQWLGADLDKNFGLSPNEWRIYTEQLTPDQTKLLELKQAQMEDPDNGPSDRTIAQQLKWTPKRVERRWGKLISLAWKVRNQQSQNEPPTKEQSSQKTTKAAIK